MRIKSFFFQYLPVIISAIILTVCLTYAWTPPSSNPPEGNISAPINTGDTSQSKTGDLNIGGGLKYWITKLGDSFALKNNSGEIKFIVGQDGNVGIGKEDPKVKLDVNGRIKALDPVDDNDVVTKGYMDAAVGKGIVGGWCRQKIRTMFSPYYYIVEKTIGVASISNCPPSASCYSLEGCLPKSSENYYNNSTCCDCPPGYFLQPVGELYEGAGSDKWINYLCIKDGDYVDAAGETSKWIPWNDGTISPNQVCVNAGYKKSISCRIPIKLYVNYYGLHTYSDYANCLFGIWQPPNIHGNSLGAVDGFITYLYNGEQVWCKHNRYLNTDEYRCPGTRDDHTSPDKFFDDAGIELLCSG